MEFKLLPMPDRANLCLKLTETTSGPCSDSPTDGTSDTVTNVADLTGARFPGKDWNATQEQLDELKRNICRPRYNLGGNGPPGRVD